MVEDMTEPIIEIKKNSARLQRMDISEHSYSIMNSRGTKCAINLLKILAICGLKVHAAFLPKTPCYNHNMNIREIVSETGEMQLKNMNHHTCNAEDNLQWFVEAPAGQYNLEISGCGNPILHTSQNRFQCNRYGSETTQNMNYVIRPCLFGEDATHGGEPAFHPSADRHGIKDNGLEPWYPANGLETPSNNWKWNQSHFGQDYMVCETLLGEETTWSYRPWQTRHSQPYISI